MRASTVGQGASQVDIRLHNEELALSLIAQHGRITRRALAAGMRLTKPAVSRIVANLAARGLLSETEPEPGPGPGRPTSYLSLARGAHVIFAVDLRLDGLVVQARDLAGTLLTEARLAHPRSMTTGQVVGIVADQIRSDTERLGLAASCVGLAVGSTLSADSTEILESPYRPWRHVPLPQMLRAALGPGAPPVTMRDVASCAALANWQELVVDVEISELAHLQVGIGAGGGLVQRRRALPSVTSLRVAHVPMQADGPTCACGATGCLDAVAGFDALVAAAAATGLRPREGPDMLTGYCRELAGRADAGDPDALAAIRQVAGWLARAAAMMINIVQPSRFTYGGYPVLLGPAFHDRFVEILGHHVPDVATVLTATSLGTEASVKGAYWLALRHVMAPTDPVVAAAVPG